MLRTLFAALLAVLLPLAAPVAFAHDGHVHEAHDVAAEGAPEIRGFRIDRDPAGGWVVALDVTNFRFVPDDAPDAAGEHLGHARLFINGTELGPIYGPTHYIDELPFGPHDFRVVLNTRAHEEIGVIGRPIEARFTLTVE